MALSAKLELRQGQQLVMTPQLQQAIRLLQLSNLELTEFVDAELERNPLLEREETTSAAKPAEEPQPERAEEPRATAPMTAGWISGSPSAITPAVSMPTSAMFSKTPAPANRQAARQ